MGTRVPTIGGKTSLRWRVLRCLIIVRPGTVHRGKPCNWKLTTLNRELRHLLVGISRQSTLEGTPCFFLRQDRWRMFGLLGLGGAALTPLLIWWCGSVSEPTWVRLLLAAAAGLLGLWTVSLWLEFAKTCRSELRPYILVTPRELIRVGYDHGDLEGYKLRDVEDFKALRTYSKVDKKTYTGTTYTGTEYTFRFPADATEKELQYEWVKKLDQKTGKDPLLAQKFSFKLFAQAEIDALEAVLALAREPASVNAVVEITTKRRRFGGVAQYGSTNALRLDHQPIRHPLGDNRDNSVAGSVTGLLRPDRPSHSGQGVMAVKVGREVVA